jgi:orotidine-5'-phosphate decarboxylase
MDIASRIFVAIDRADLAQAKADASRVTRASLKLGLEFFTANGPQGIREVAGGRRLFLDLKLHDIPNTVAGAVRSIAGIAPDFLTVHASGGADMLKAAVAEAADAGRRTKLLGVTVLTSLDDDDLATIGQRGPALDQVKRLAALAQSSGLDGVICSPAEIAALRQQCGQDFALVVPGIRPDWAAAADQKRVMTPAEAFARGADYLVIGRPITQAPDPAAALARIVDEIAAAVS